MVFVNQVFYRESGHCDDRGERGDQGKRGDRGDWGERGDRDESGELYDDECVWAVYFGVGGLFYCLHIIFVIIEWSFVNLLVIGRKKERKKKIKIKIKIK